jgi:hypothetical protein
MLDADLSVPRHSHSEAREKLIATVLRKLWTEWPFPFKGAK